MCQNLSEILSAIREFTEYFKFEKPFDMLMATLLMKYLDITHKQNLCHSLWTNFGTISIICSNIID